MPGNMAGLTFTEDMIAASGVTNVGITEASFDVENLTTELEIEEVYAVSGEEVTAGDKILKLTEDSVEEARKELDEQGGQQQNLRSGTENVPGIAGLAKAAEMLYSHFDEDHARLCACKRRFIEGVERLDQVKVNGLLPDAPYGEGTAAHIVSVSFAGVRSEVLLHALEDKGIYVSAGSACSAHKPQPSATLKAIGIDKSLLDSTIRFSFSVFTTEEEIDVCLQALYNIVPMLRRYSRR